MPNTIRLHFGLITVSQQMLPTAVRIRRLTVYLDFSTSSRNGVPEIAPLLLHSLNALLHKIKTVGQFECQSRNYKMDRLWCTSTP